MNINPAAINAVSVAEEIGLIAGCIAAAIPNLPPDDADVAAAVNADESAIAAGVNADEYAIAAGADAVNGAVIDAGDDAAPSVANDPAGSLRREI